MKHILLLATLALFTSCHNGNDDFDAQGTFEADEVIVSSEISGKITQFNISEGDIVQTGKSVAQIDATPLTLQKEQTEASIQSLHQKTLDVAPQIELLKDQLEVQNSQLKNLQHEKARIENLLKQDAATGKQLDDIKFQIEVAQKQIKVTQQQIAVQQNNVSTQNRGILSEGNPLQKRAAQLQDQIQRATIINPVTGTVLTTYALQGETTTTGKALYKIADLNTIFLRAYVTGTQLAKIKLGQTAKVFIDNGDGDYRNYNGNISWISNKAEFTPKTIQTQEERANLVYAIKIKVKNDGLLKIGMFGEVKFN
jgi:HlyD family secretion protein